jgi:hypothetical protein
LTKTGNELNDIGRSLSWDALDSFLKNIGPDSAIMRECYPELEFWGTTQKTNRILADIWDVLMLINANLVAIGERRPTKAFKKYPRPWDKNPDDEQHIGSGGLPPDELQKWFDKKRAEHNARSSTGDNNRHAGNGGRTGKNNE